MITLKLLKLTIMIDEQTSLGQDLLLKIRQQLGKNLMNSRVLKWMFTMTVVILPGNKNLTKKSPTPTTQARPQLIYIPMA